MKILSGYLVTAIFLAVVTGVGVFSQKDISARLDEATIQGRDMVVSARALKLHAESMQRSLGIFGGTSSPKLLELLEFQKKQADKALEHLLVMTGNDPAIEEISRLFYRALERAQADQAVVGVSQGASPGSGFAPLINRLDVLLLEKDFASESLMRSTSTSSPYYSTLILSLGILGIVIGGCLVAVVVFYVLGALNKLQISTHFIGDGAFDVEPQVTSHDEIGDLSRALASMGKKLKSYEEKCLDASPLTRLPGNIAIERALLDRMRRGEKFALCYADLDYFKAYNDRYGYARGSGVIKGIAELIFQAKQKHARSGDFVGHIGGDDFVLITSPALVDTVCKNIISEFDRVIPEYYDSEDREKGYIEGTDRYGVKRRFPLLTISIAVVSDAQRNIQSPTEIAQVAAEIKDFVKTLPGSNYLFDRRRNPR